MTPKEIDLLQEIEENLDINNLSNNINVINKYVTKLEKGDHNYKKYDYSFTIFISIELNNNKYIMLPEGYGNYNKNDDIITGGNGIFEYKKDFDSIYDLKRLL